MSEHRLPMLSYNNTNNMNSLHNSSLGHWDQYFHDFGVLNDTESLSLVMEDGNSTPTLLSSSLICEDDHSSGYLEDALVEFTKRSKRRRLLMFGHGDDHSDFLHHKSSSSWESAHDFSFISEMSGYNDLSDEATTTSLCSVGEEENTMATDPVKTVCKILDSSASSSSSYKDSANNSANDQSINMSYRETIFSVDPLDCDEKTSPKKKRAVIRKVVYPFAVVKPGGREDDVTLNDINERILMPPTRPVRHPVGAFACRPNCVLPHGPGLSGKVVVALTKIQTRGRGTITIIRTKG